MNSKNGTGKNGKGKNGTVKMAQEKNGTGKNGSSCKIGKNGTNSFKLFLLKKIILFKNQK